MIVNNQSVASLRTPLDSFDEIVWPQFAVEDEIPFDDFLTRFEEIFALENLPASAKFACFRQCLSRFPPSVIQSSRALDIRDFDTAVRRLRPFVSIPEERRTANIRAQYASIQQSRGQSLQQYYDNFIRVNASHGLASSESLNLFYCHMLPSLRSHLASLYLIADEKGISVDQLFSRIKRFLDVCPAPGTFLPDSIPNSTPARTACVHCGGNHAADRCYTKYPHLLPTPKLPTISLLSHVVPLRLPTFRLNLEGVGYTVLLDTGAAISCISASRCNQTPWLDRNLQRSPISVRTSYGRTTQTLGYIDLAFNNTLIRFHVLEGLDVDLLFGWDLIDRMDFTIRRTGILFHPIDGPSFPTSQPAFQLPDLVEDCHFIPFRRHSRRIRAHSIQPVQSITDFDVGDRVVALVEENRDLFAPNPRAPPRTDITTFPSILDQLFPLRIMRDDPPVDPVSVPLPPIERGDVV